MEAYTPKGFVPKRFFNIVRAAGFPTIESFAGESGISLGRIKTWRDDLVTPTDESMAKAAAVLECDPGELRHATHFATPYCDYTKFQERCGRDVR